MKRDYSYQPPIISKTFDNLLISSQALLAACPGAGKTRMAIEIIRKYKKRYPKSRVLVLTHGQLMLRDQWLDVISEHAPDLKPIVHAKSSEDLGLQLKEGVVLAIPQSLWNCFYSTKDNIDLLIIDEAHHFAEAQTSRETIAKLKPKHQLRLTGTPSLYVDREDWKVEGITVNTLLGYGVLTDPRIELAKSYYKYGMEDYQANLSMGHGMKLAPQKTKATMAGILKKLGPRINEKTMFISYSQEEAKNIHAFLTKEKINALISVSDLTNGSDELVAFKKDPKVKALVVVNRGTLGFDFEELSTIVDLSATLNVNRLFQMLCRVVRLNSKNPKQEKLFLKVCPESMSFITHYIMSFVVALSQDEYYFTYKTKNTKNSTVPVSIEFLERVKELIKERRRGRDVSDRIKIASLPKLDTFKALGEKIKLGVQSYAVTSFNIVRELTFKRKNDMTYEQCIELAKASGGRYLFKQKHINHYKFLQNRGLLTDLDDIYPPKIKTDWTLEGVLALAKTFKSKSLFREAHHGAFKWLKKNGHMDKLLKLDFERGGYKRIRWTREAALAEVKKLKNKKNIHDNRPGLYSYLRRAGLWYEIFPR